MTVEHSVLVAVPRSGAVAQLVGDVLSAAERSRKSDPGDRVDVVRYEALSVQLEAIASWHLAAGANSGANSIVLDEPLPAEDGCSFAAEATASQAAGLIHRLPDDAFRWVAERIGSAVVVELRRPLEPGATRLNASASGPPDVAETWAIDDDVPPRRAATERFRSQIESVIASAGTDVVTRDHSIVPSGINNRILTQTLREFVQANGHGRVEAPVTYRDGSEASHPFRLRCLNLVDRTDHRGSDLTLSLALLSIRHTEMDAVVDGAWLRNAEVSRPRPAALTDDFVYQTSLAQLLEVTGGGSRSVTLRIYQTGLDTAVVGFYRAVVDHLLAFPRSLIVDPMFYVASKNKEALVTQAPFARGKPWAVDA